MSPEETPFAQSVRHELEAARLGHAPIHSAQEGFAVTVEEVFEFWRIVVLAAEQRDPLAMAMALVQIAATCPRVAEDLKLPHHLPAHRRKEAGH